jgi:hypothetical protein
MLGTDYRNGITRYEICIWCRHLTLILLSDPRFFEKLERFPKVTGCSVLIISVSWKSRDGPSASQGPFSSSRINSRQTLKRGILWNRLVLCNIAALAPTD